ncbi:hypothetical protein AR688_04500 [Rheinheimera sp. EpRS3]|nr:hypothetical protein AR688_04500 [Rheinheimera sp. EpRS3]
MSTNRADYRYIVKELPYKESSVWALECYPETQQLPFVSKTGSMYIELKQGITEVEAKELRDMLNEKASYITVINP